MGTAASNCLAQPMARFLSRLFCFLCLALLLSLLLFWSVSLVGGGDDARCGGGDLKGLTFCWTATLGRRFLRRLEATGEDAVGDASCGKVAVAVAGGGGGGGGGFLGGIIVIIDDVCCVVLLLACVHDLFVSPLIGKQ